MRLGESRKFDNHDLLLVPVVIAALNGLDGAAPHNVAPTILRYRSRRQGSVPLEAFWIDYLDF